MNTTIELWLSCGGRRIALLDAFRNAAKSLGVSLNTIVLDQDARCATALAADQFIQVAPVDTEAWREFIDHQRTARKAGLIIPLLDTELLFWSERRTLLPVLVSSPDVIRLTRDKLSFQHHLEQIGIQECQTFPIDAIPEQALPFPLLVKPRSGSNSIGVTLINDAESVAYYARMYPDAIASKVLLGQEYSVDAYVTATGEVRCVVPRKRLKVRSGEVVISETDRNEHIIERTTTVISQLEGLRGPVCVQGFFDNGQFTFTELNARFGGGVPLSIAAGADYPELILREHLGLALNEMTWKSGMLMSRYDGALFR